MLKITRRTAKLIFILCLPPLLASAAIAAAVNCPALYTHGFDKYNVAAVTGLSPGELEGAARGLISYWNSPDEYVQVTVIKDGAPFPLFNQREIDHLADVKKLFRRDYLVLTVTLAYTLAYALYLLWRRRRRDLAQVIVAGCGVTVITVAAFGALAVFDFNRFFLNFHLISFSNDLWQLDPTRDYLIMLFPGGFWQDACLYIAVAIFGIALIPNLIATAYIARRQATRF